MNFDLSIDKFLEAVESYKLVFVAVFIIASAAIIIFFTVSPKYAQVKELNEKMHRYEKNIEKKREQNTRDIKALENSAALKEKYTQLKSRYFTEEEYTAFIVTGAKEIADQYQVELIDYKIGKPFGINNELVSYPFIVDAAGYYENLRRFIKEMESYKKIITMSDFTLVKGKDGGDSPVIKVTLQLNLYTINIKKEKKVDKQKR